MNKFKKYSAENSPNAWLYLLPLLVIVGLFNIYPLIKAFIMSFQKGTLTNMQFDGINNYTKVITDPQFHDALKNTALYAFVVVPASIIISLYIAWLIYEKVKFKKFFETVFFLPYLTSTIAVGIVFKYLFNYNFGFINYVLGWFKIAPINFLDSTSMSIWTVIIFGIWLSLAFNIIIILSGLRNINPYYYKVADMFGATKFEQFIRITLPQLIPILTFLLSVGLIGAFKVYSQVFAIFSGKPGIGKSAMTAVFYIYSMFYENQKYGQSMAATMILFAIILLVTLIQRKIVRKIEG